MYDILKYLHLHTNINRVVPVLQWHISNGTITLTAAILVDNLGVFSQCYFSHTCHPQMLSIWTSLKFCHVTKGLFVEHECFHSSPRFC